MKQLAPILLLAFLLVWLSGMGQTTLIENENKEYLSNEEIMEQIAVPDFNKVYYTTEKTTYLIKRKVVPFTYERDTIAKDKKRWFNESPYSE